MKVFVVKTSESFMHGKVMDFENLDDCIDMLLRKEDFGEFNPGVVVTRIDYEFVPDAAKECKYQVEIYDTWRE